MEPKAHLHYKPRRIDSTSYHEVKAADAVAKLPTKNSVAGIPISQAPWTLIATPASSVPTVKHAKLMVPANSGCGSKRFV